MAWLPAPLDFRRDLRAALETADFAYVLETGSIVHKGKAADLIHDPKVVASYLGGRET